MPTFCCHNRPDYSKIKEKTVVYRDGLSFVETLTDIIVQLVKTITARYFSATNYCSMPFRMNFAKHPGHGGTFSTLLLFRNLRKETRNVPTNSHHLGFLRVNTLTLNKYQLMLTGAKNRLSAQNTMSLGKWLLELCILTLQFNTQYVPTSSKPY